MTKEELKEQYYILVFNKGIALFGASPEMKEYAYNSIDEAVEYRNKALVDYEKEINMGLLYISPVLKGYK